jgi:hypothetical protein
MNLRTVDSANGHEPGLFSMHSQQMFDLKEKNVLLVNYQWKMKKKSEEKKLLFM